MLQDAKVTNNKEASEQQLKSEVEYRKNLQEICNKIYGGQISSVLAPSIRRLSPLRPLPVHLHEQNSSDRHSISRFRHNAYLGKCLPRFPGGTRKVNLQGEI